MKILVVCYSLMGKTRKIASCLAESVGADFVEMREISGRSVFHAYSKGVYKASTGKTEDIRPVAADVAAYDCIIVAGPVWGDYPAPALYDFIREYSLDGKQSYGLLTYSKDAKKAVKVLRSELERANTKCRSVITVKSKSSTIRALLSHQIEFILNDDGKLALKDGSNAVQPHTSDLNLLGGDDTQENIKE